MPSPFRRAPAASLALAACLALAGRAGASPARAQDDAASWRPLGTTPFGLSVKYRTVRKLFSHCSEIAVTNTTTEPLYLEFVKEYTLSNGDVEPHKGSLILRPGEALAGSAFAGELDLSDCFFGRKRIVGLSLRWTSVSAGRPTGAPGPTPLRVGVGDSAAVPGTRP